MSDKMEREKQTVFFFFLAGNGHICSLRHLLYFVFLKQSKNGYLQVFSYCTPQPYLVSAAEMNNVIFS
jgi:hypothetical protein